MNNLLAARSQMGVSLAFHIIFAAIGIAVPLMMVIAEWRWIVTKDDAYLLLAKRWAKGTTILAAVGAVSGTVLSFELGILWPQFMRYAGAIIGMAKGYAATTMADLSHAAHTSAGKLTHHFPTKGNLFEAIFGSLMEAMEAGRLATLADATLSPKKRIHGFLDGMYRLYAKQPNPIGCPLGHAAGDSHGVSPAMKEKALKILQQITSLFDEAFRDLGEAPGMARVKANLFVSAWQGAIVVARAGEGLEHISRVFRYLKEIVPLSC